MSFLIPMLIGAVTGAVVNPEDRLRGALMGGTLGAVTGGIGNAATPAVSSGLTNATTSALGNAVTNTAAQTAASHAAAEAAAQKAAAEAVKQGLSSEAVRQASIPVVEQGMSSAVINSGVQANALAAKEAALAVDAAQKAALTKDAVVGVDAASKAGAALPERGLDQLLKDAGTTSQRVTDLNIPEPSLDSILNRVDNLTSQSISDIRAGAEPLKGFDKLKHIVKENPMESMQFVNALSPQEQQAQPVTMAPVTQPQITPPPSVEERIATSGAGAPTFVPKGLFDETRSSLDEEEERRMMFEQLTAAGLV